MGTVIDERGFIAAGRALESARLSAGQTLDQVSGSLGIRPLYLEALERGELGRTLGPTYAESMIVRYAMHLGMNSEALLSAAAKHAAGASDPAPAAPATPAATEAAIGPKTAPALAGISVGLPKTRRSSQARAGGSSGAGGSRPPLLRVAVVSALAVALVATGIFGALELGIFSIFSGGDSQDAERSSPSVAVAVTGDATPTTVGPVAPNTTTATSTTTMLASTTTTAVQVAVSFSVVLKAKEDVWVEFREATSGEALHVGMVAKGDSVNFAAAGPVNAVVGKPGALSLQVDGRTVQTPSSFRWLISSTGVEDRP